MMTMMIIIIIIIPGCVAEIDKFSVACPRDCVWRRNCFDETLNTGFVIRAASLLSATHYDRRAIA